jgi:hypothetical protein
MKSMGKIASLCAAAAVICSAGCAPDQDEYWAASTAQYHQEMNRIQADYESAMKRISETSEACRHAIASMKIGSSEIDLLTKHGMIGLPESPCRESQINTTATGATVHDQWVYGLSSGNAYLYYDNGRLVAVQF